MVMGHVPRKKAMDIDRWKALVCDFVRYNQLILKSLFGIWLGNEVERVNRRQFLMPTKFHGQGDRSKTDDTPHGICSRPQ